MKIVSLLFLSVLSFVTSPSTRETLMSDERHVGGVPRLATDAGGNPMLSWIEKDSAGKVAFYFALSNNGGRTFGSKTRVAAPPNLSIHAEGMPKIARKADGTVLAVFEVPHPTAESRFSGELLYTTSVDGGKNWSRPKTVYQDTSPGGSHSFSDITRLPNGEIGIVWLDEKLPNHEGRPVKFAQTTPGLGFGSAVLVDENACQCCRTSIFVDDQHNIHLTYRDLLPGLGVSSKQPASRDISHAVSTDGGRTFSKPRVVYADHWQINACPHAGPMVAQVDKAIFVTWFSGREGAAGLRLARLGADTLVSNVWSNRAKHPQIVAMDRQIVWVWDESVAKDSSGELGSFRQRIGIRTITEGKNTPTNYLTDDTVNAMYPTVLATKNGLLIAYEQTKEQHNPVIVVRLIESL